MKTIGDKRMKTILVAMITVASVLALLPIANATEPVIIAVNPASYNVKVGDTMTINMTVNPNGTDISSVGLDYYYWDVGRMELIGVARGNLFVDTTVTTGWENYTTLPGSALATNQSYTWNYTLTTNLANCNDTLTKVRILGGTKKINASIKINGVEVENYTGVIDMNSTLADWKNDGAPTNVAYISITIKNLGANATQPIRLYMVDLNHRLMTWGSQTTNGDTNEYTYAIFTFKPLTSGTCVFSIDPSAVAVANGEDHITFNITRATSTIHIFDYYYPEQIGNFVATPYNRTQVDLTWTTGYWTDRSVIIGKIGSYPTSQTDGIVIYNNTGTSTSQTGMSPGQHWYYRAWGYNTTDNVYSQTYAQADATTTGNNAPTLSSESPINGSSPVDKMQSSVSVSIADVDLDKMNWTIQTSNGNSNSGNISSDGVISCALTTPLPYSTIVTWYVNVTDGYDTSRAIYSFTTRSEYVPGEPSSFDATTYNRTQINLSFIKGTGADKTYVEWNDHATWAIGTGNFIHNGTGTSYNHQNLKDGTQYYYQAWGWNSTDNTYSAIYMSDDATTVNNLVSILSGENPSDGSGTIDKLQATVSVTVTDPEGDNVQWQIHGPYVTTNSGTTYNGSISANLITPLPYDTVIYWYVNTTDGFDWTNATYSFTVRSVYAPGAPTGLTATTIDRTQINLAWSKGSLADTTYVERYSSPTWSRGTGTPIYSGAGSSFPDTGRYPNTHYYYQAWSWNNTDSVYSSSYAAGDNTTDPNYLPTFSNEGPANNSIDVDKTQAVANITINDANGDTFNYKVGGNYITTLTGSGTNGTYQATLVNPLSYSAVVNWYVNASDTYGYTNNTYTFTARSQYNPAGPTGFTATPVSTSEIDLSWTNGAANFNSIRVEWNTMQTWVRGTGNFLMNGTNTTYNHNGRNPHAAYYYQAWSYNITDDAWSAVEQSNATTFTTVPTVPINEQPINNTDYLSVYNSYMNVTSTDADADSIKMEFYWGNGTAIAYLTVSSGAFANLTLPDYMDPDWLAHDTTYSWYSIANDTYGGLNQSGVFNFHTSQAWDINEDKTIDTYDVSLLVAHYGASLIAGSQGWDIDNSGVVDTYDVSGLVSHYGQMY